MKFLKKLLRRKVKKQETVPEEIKRIYLLNGGKGWNVRLNEN